MTESVERGRQVLFPVCFARRGQRCVFVIARVRPTVNICLAWRSRPNLTWNRGPNERIYDPQKLQPKELRSICQARWCLPGLTHGVDRVKVIPKTRPIVLIIASYLNPANWRVSGVGSSPRKAIKP